MPPGGGGLHSAMPTIDECFLFPEPRIIRTPADFGIGDFREVRFPNENGHTLHGWFISPPPQPSPGRGKGETAKPLVILSHGNAANVGEFLPWVAPFRDAGHPVLLYDYQGFGRSAGPAQIAALLGDGRSVLRWANKNGAAGVGTVMAGLSLGTVVSLGAAATVPPELRPRALVLEGAFVPRDEIPKLFGPLGAAVASVLVHQLPADIVPDKQIPALRMPMLFLQAGADAVTSTAGARKLYDLAPGPKEWRLFAGAAHLEPLARDPAGYEKTVRDFLERHLGAGETT